MSIHTHLNEEMNHPTVLFTKKSQLSYPDIRPMTFASKKEGKLVTKTCLFLESNLSALHSLDSIAMAMGTNRSKLAYSFKIETGSTVFEWLRKARLEKARQLLVTTTMSIQDISFEVGYDKPCNFSTAYKRNFKVSPRDTRKLTQQKKIITNSNT